MSTRLHEMADTLLWLGAGLVAVVAAPLLLLARAALPAPTFAPPRPSSSTHAEHDDR